MNGETFYTLRWKRGTPPIDYSICDAYDGHELYLTSDQKDALAERKRLSKKRHVKLLAFLYGRIYQAVFEIPPSLGPGRPRRRERLRGWRQLREPKKPKTTTQEATP